jgi:hypothetical protein
MGYRRVALMAGVCSCALACADDGDAWSSALSGGVSSGVTTASASGDAGTGDADSGSAGEQSGSTGEPPADSEASAEAGTGVDDDGGSTGVATTADATTADPGTSGAESTSASEESSSTSGASTTGPGSTSSSGGAQCGDGIAEGAEECDGNDLQGLTCSDLDHIGGSLACNGSCVFDESDCGPSCGGDGESCNVDTDCCPAYTCDEIFGCQP